MSRLIGYFVALNRRMCRTIDRCLPARISVDGNRDFAESIVPRYVRPGMRVVDVGGGKTPFFSSDTKQELRLWVVGIDVSDEELARAPASAYDEVVVADICDTSLADRADLAVCMTVIEHVASAKFAIASLARLVRPGGTVALFVPCRNALFARLNLLLPEAVKRYVLHGLYPASVHFAGFRAYYDHCTPSELEAVVRQAGLHLVEKEVYHWSGYFDFFAPFYLCWRAASLLAVALFGEDACDRFCLVAVRAE